MRAIGELLKIWLFIALLFGAYLLTWYWEN